MTTRIVKKGGKSDCEKINKDADLTPPKLVKYFKCMRKKKTL